MLRSAIAKIHQYLIGSIRQNKPALPVSQNDSAHIREAILGGSGGNDGERDQGTCM